MTPAQRTDQIKQHALRSGFTTVGVARAEALTDERAHLTEWLSRGFHGTMGWMAEDPGKRSDPQKVLPGARFVISVAMNYFTPASHTDDPLVGKISRYAWGDDYHIVLTEQLARLQAFVREIAPEAETKAYVDTGPVMDKAWAVRAGIGWLGKHGNVITRSHGSWIFLGEILTTAELIADVPMEDFCGSCTACLDACPTSAIVDPYVVDSRKCISYWTIEHRGSIDPAIIPQLSGWVYGCDICQDVCPWNRFATPTDERRFAPRSENVAPDLRELASITQEEFSRRFKRSPVKRTKREGLSRNAKALLGPREPFR